MTNLKIKQPKNSENSANTKIPFINTLEDLECQHETDLFRLKMLVAAIVSGSGNDFRFVSKTEGVSAAVPSDIDVAPFLRQERDMLRMRIDRYQLIRATFLEALRAGPTASTTFIHGE